MRRSRRRSPPSTGSTCTPPTSASSANPGTVVSIKDGWATVFQPPCSGTPRSRAIKACGRPRRPYGAALQRRFVRCAAPRCHTARHAATRCAGPRFLMRRHSPPWTRFPPRYPCGASSNRARGFQNPPGRSGQSDTHRAWSTVLDLVWRTLRSQFWRGAILGCPRLMLVRRCPCPTPQPVRLKARWL
jgi:hypothetical protein